MNQIIQNKNIFSSTIRKDMLFGILKQNQTRDGFYSHVSMGNTKGKYSFNRKTLPDLYTGLRKVSFYGVAEKPQYYSMLRFDFDFKKKTSCKTLIPLYKEELFLNCVIPEIQKFISEKIKKYEKKHSDCVVFVKDPYYIKEKTVLKNGFHIVFPNLFISKPNFDLIENHFSEIFSKNNPKFGEYYCGFDSISSSPWLMYGQGKNISKGVYLPKYVILQNGSQIDVSKYFLNYEIYSENEEIIKMSNTEKVVNNYPRIFSIVPYNRNISEFKKTQFIQNNTESNHDFDNDDEYMEEINNIVNVYIENEDFSIEHSTWKGHFITLKRTKTGSCPTQKNRKHDNRDAYCRFSNGKVFVGCFCGESKTIVIGTYKSDIGKNEFNFNCKEAAEVYKSNNSSKFDNMTYGEIVKTDLDFSNWIINECVLPHCEKFAKILNKEIKYSNLENIHPNEIINQNNIGSYKPRLKKADVVCLRSNMMTFKTQNLKELCKENSEYKRILVISFRCSLEEEYKKDFGEYGFELYSDLKGLYEDIPRLIVQIDSLHKVIGRYDLLVLDEIVYTMDHLYSFVKQKDKCWSCLNDYISSTPKIIACDALLNMEAINLFKRNGKSIWIVENKYTSFSDKKVVFIEFPDTSEMINYIEKYVKEGKNVYVPTNSKTFAGKLFNYLKNKDISCELACDTNYVATKNWNKQVFITTPTNVAGISFNEKHFDKVVGYFTSSSCSAELATQMIFRVRNTTDSLITVFIKKCPLIGRCPIKIQEIKKYIKSRDEIFMSSGLKFDYKRCSIIEDDYFNSYVKYLQKINLNKVMYEKTLKKILLAHGIKEDDNLVSLSDKIKEIYADEKTSEKINKLVKTTTKIAKGKEYDNVVNSSLLSKNEYTKISDKNRKTKHESFQLRKYRILEGFAKGGLTEAKLTPDFVKTFEGKICKYKTLCEMNTEYLEGYIQSSINTFLKTNKSNENTKRLHENYINRMMKMFCVDRIIKEIGFDSVFDKKEINKYPYEKMKNFMIEHGEKISLLFGSKQEDWKAIDIQEENGKRKLSKEINGKIKSVLGINVLNKHRGRKAKLGIHEIKGFDSYDKNNIIIPVNDLARRIHIENNMRILTHKKQCGNNVWKMWFEMVENRPDFRDEIVFD